MNIQATFDYSPLQFALWRIAFGAYLLFYVARIFPYRFELFTEDGMFPDATLSWVYGYLPNPLASFDSPVVITSVFAVLFVASALVLFGAFRRCGALVIWAGLAMLFGRNPLIEDPALPFVGLLLVLVALVPAGEPLSAGTYVRRITTGAWVMPAYIYWGAWFIVAFTFSVTGLDRVLNSEVWASGAAMRLLIEQRIAYDYWLVEFIRTLPPAVFIFQSWFSLVVYTLSLPLIFLPFTRPIIWGAWVIMFLYIFLTLDLTQVVLGMLLFFFFLFDLRWMPRARLRPRACASEGIPTQHPV